jgi:hypothetical protein
MRRRHHGLLSGAWVSASVLIRSVVAKVEFRELLAKLRRVVEEAEELGGHVECLGD